MRPRGRFCDFCHAKNPPHWVACRSFTVDEVIPMRGPMIMRDDWAACDECYALVEARDHEGLLKRGMDSYFAHHPEDALYRDTLEKQVRRAYEQFWEMRIEEKGIES